MLDRLLTRTADRSAARRLLDTVSGQARKPAFYLAGGVEDTLDGRFDLVVLHCWLALARLKAEPPGPKTRRLAQGLTDGLFGRFDEALREMGVGDLSVARRMKAFAGAYMGRLAAYDAALAAPDPEAALREALHRNLYREAEVAPERLAAMAAYVLAARAALAAEPGEAVCAGAIGFPAPDFGSGIGSGTGAMA